MRSKPLIFAVALALGAYHASANAAPCSGFNDVDTADAFCGAVEWIKNRGVTTGCTATEYCPTNNVTRAQMALFMNRLGKALTPEVLHDAGYLMNTQVPGFPGTLACATPDYQVVGYPRTARFLGQFWGQPSGTTASFQGYFMFSTDGGANWQMIASGADQMTARVSATSAQSNGSAVLAPPLALAPGTTYRFGLFIDGVGVTNPFTLLVCEMEVTIQNANPATSPLDH